MAVLIKGILGTPKGKIANIMGYDRNGTSIIQSVPTVIDSKKRIYNLSKKALYEFIDILLDTLSVGNFNTWRSFLDFPLDFDAAFLSWNRNYADSLMNRNVTGLWTTPPKNMTEFEFNIQFDRGDRLVTISFETYDLASLPFIPRDVLITGTDVNFVGQWIYILPYVVGQFTYEKQIVQAHYDKSTQFRCIVRFFPTNVNSQSVVTDQSEIRT